MNRCSQVSSSSSSSSSSSNVVRVGVGIVTEAKNEEGISVRVKVGVLVHMVKRVKEGERVEKVS